MEVWMVVKEMHGEDGENGSERWRGGVIVLE